MSGTGEYGAIGSEAIDGVPHNRWCGDGECGDPAHADPTQYEQRRAGAPPMPRGPMDESQSWVDDTTSELWPGETIEEAALALCEEAGEVARAVIKRNHAHRHEGDRAPQDWTANLRTELAQVVIVAMKMAEREGFSLAYAVDEEMATLNGRLARRIELTHFGRNGHQAE